MTRTHRCNDSHEINGMYTENVNTDSEVKLHWDLCHLWYFELTKVKAAMPLQSHWRQQDFVWGGAWNWKKKLVV